MERQRTMRIQDALWNAGCSGRVAKADSVVLAGFDRRKRFLLALQQRFVVVVSVMHGLSRNRNYNDAFRLEIGGPRSPNGRRMSSTNPKRSRAGFAIRPV